MNDPLLSLHQSRRDLEFALTLIPEGTPGWHQVVSAHASVQAFIASLTPANERLLPGEDSGICADDDGTGYLRGLQDEHGDITFTLSAGPRSLTGPHVRMTVSPVRRPAVFRAAKLLIWTLNQASPPWASADTPHLSTLSSPPQKRTSETESDENAGDSPPWL